MQFRTQRFVFWIVLATAAFGPGAVNFSYGQTGGTGATAPRKTAGTSGAKGGGSPVYGPSPAPGGVNAGSGGAGASGAGVRPAGSSKAKSGAGAAGEETPFRDPQLSEPVIRQAVPSAMATPRAPEWIPLPPEHEKYLDQVLAYWQESSAKIKRYRSKFTRWEYDAVFGPPRDPSTGELPAKTQSVGVIKYAAPDKGLFKVDQILHYTPGKKPGEKPQYLPQAGDPGEHWVCDGKSVFSFDHSQKKLLQTELPPEMQGKSIVDGPLPFMFGAEASKIKQRFWIRVITPKDATNEYWLEAVPKMRGDAANFKMLHIIIDAGDFLPKAMAMFNRNYDPQTNPSATNFVFEKREVNWNETIDKINIFAKEFWEPSAPLGYKKVVERYQPTAEERISAPTPSTKQAVRPAPANAAPRATR